MNLNAEMLLQAANLIAAKGNKRDLIWDVASFRINCFVLLKEAGLGEPNDHAYGGDEGGAVKATLVNLLTDYCQIAAQFPLEVKQTNDEVEHPRLEIIQRSIDIYNGLKSEADSWSSAQELAKIVATNDDGQNEKLDFSALFGVIARIYEHAGYSAQWVELINQAINLYK